MMIFVQRIIAVGGMRSATLGAVIPGNEKPFQP
jgi:hypothetical protein